MKQRQTQPTNLLLVLLARIGIRGWRKPLLSVLSWIVCVVPVIDVALIMR